MKINITALLLLHLFVGLHAMDTVVDKITLLVEQYKQHPEHNRPIVAIAGCSSVGKTYFTQKLLEELEQRNIKTRLLPLDYFMHPSTQLEYDLEPGEFNSRVGHQVWQFDHRFVHQVLKAIVAKEAIITEPHLDLKTCQKTLVTHDYSDVQLVIIEGIYALSGPEAYDFALYSTLKIFMDGNREQLLKWYCAMKRGKGHPNPEEDPITAWDFDEDYAQVIAPSKKYADILLHQNENREYSVENI